MSGIRRSKGKQVFAWCSPHLYRPDNKPTAAADSAEEKKPPSCSKPACRDQGLWDSVPCPQWDERAQDARPSPCKLLWTQTSGHSMSCAGHAWGPQPCSVCCPSKMGVPVYCQLLPPVGSGTFSPRRARSTSECHTSPALAQCSQNQRTWIHRFQTWWAPGVLLSGREVGWFVAVLLMPSLETPGMDFP